MNFGEAIDCAVNVRAAIQRAGWNGKTQFVVYMPPMTLTGDEVNHRTLAHLPVGVGIEVKGYFVIASPGRNPHLYNWQPGWVPSQADILADDWQIVDIGTIQAWGGQ